MIAFVFPGQGSQHVGMGRDLLEKSPMVQKTFREAEEILGFAISRLCLEGPEETLLQTANAQPAILTLSVALTRLIECLADVPPQYVAGHSLGEYSALVAAGAMSFESALKVVRRRGELMQEAGLANQGGMAAIVKLDAEAVEAICREAAEGEVVSPANYNASDQIVVSGHSQAVGRAMKLASDRGGIALPLPVSGAFHSRLMESAAQQLADDLARVQFSKPKIPVLSNVTAEPHDDPERIADRLVQQITSPVRWHDTMRKLKELGVTDVAEIGPGNILTRLTEKIDPTLRRLSYSSDEDAGQSYAQLSQARKQGLVDAGWQERNGLMFSPSKDRVMTPRGDIFPVDPRQLSSIANERPRE